MDTDGVHFWDRKQSTQRELATKKAEAVALRKQEVYKYYNNEPELNAFIVLVR
jgi:hypothetical protein